MDDPHINLGLVTQISYVYKKQLTLRGHPRFSKKIVYVGVDVDDTAFHEALRNPTATGVLAERIS